MIYLDNAATTRVCPEAAAAALSAMTELYGNPSSLHETGFEAERLVAEARKAVAASLGAEPSELVFTPSGTFADNLAVLGTARRVSARGGHIISTAIEHPAVLNALKQAEAEGCSVTLVAPNADGRVDAERVLAEIRPETALISVMLVNNELGTLQPVAKLGAALRAMKRPPLLHTDAVQAYMKLPRSALSARALGADMITVSAHKIAGPKGVGALYVRKGVSLRPLVFGGGQERGLSPGTEPVPAIAAFAAAVKAAPPDGAAKAERLKELAAEAVIALCPEAEIVSRGDGVGLLSLCLPFVRSETLTHFLASLGICVSAGSACAKGAPSHVLSAIGLAPERAKSVIRVSFGADNTEADARALADALAASRDRFSRK